MKIKHLDVPREREWKHIFQGIARWSGDEAQAIYQVLYPYALTPMQKRGYRNISKDTPSGVMAQNFIDIRERASLLFSTKNLIDSSIHDRRILKTSRDFCIKAGADPTNRIEMEVPLGKGGLAKARRRLDRKHGGAVTHIFDYVGVHPGELEVADMCDIQRYIFRIGFYVSHDGETLIMPKGNKPRGFKFVALTICLDQGDVPMRTPRGLMVIDQLDREIEIETYVDHDRYESQSCPITSKKASGLQIESAKQAAIDLMAKVIPQQQLSTRIAASCSKLGRARDIRMRALGLAGSGLSLGLKAA